MFWIWVHCSGLLVVGWWEKFKSENKVLVTTQVQLNPALLRLTPCELHKRALHNRNCFWTIASWTHAIFTNALCTILPCSDISHFYTSNFHSWSSHNFIFTQFHNCNFRCCTISFLRNCTGAHLTPSQMLQVAQELQKSGSCISSIKLPMCLFWHIFAIVEHFLLFE